MRRLVLLLALAALVGAPAPARAQEALPRVYFSYMKVDFNDMAWWIDNYQQAEVPLLQSLVQEGLLSGFGLTVHDTGGEYNVRMALLAPTWDNLDDVWAAYFERMPAESMATGMAMIREHTDEIWALAESQMVEGDAVATHLYESTWDVRYDQLESWLADFEQYGKPALQRAMDEGLITGWARLEHDTGAWNVRYVYWLTDWDAADDLIAMLLESRQGADPEGMRAARAHEDNVWRLVPQSGGN